MGFPQVTDRLKAAPLQALRAVFAGIGRLLLAADRARSQASGQRPGQPGRAGQGPGQPGGPAAGRAAGPARQRGRETAEAAVLAAAAADEARRRSLDHSGNVRLLTAEGLPGRHTAPGLDAAVAEATGGPGAGLAAAGAETAGTPAGSAAQRPAPPAAARLPLANYDALSLASLRARLRNLDSAQLQVLLDYELAHAGREAVVTMFQRRIVKLDSGRG